MNSPKKQAMVEACSVDRTLQIVSDPWSFLVLREMWFRLRKFDEFQEALNIPRATLSDRLRKLVAAGLIKHTDNPEGGKRKIYKFTEKGADLYPVMLTLMAWGDRWRKTAAGKPLLVRHNCGCEQNVEVVYSCCDKLVDPYAVEYGDGAGAGMEPLPEKIRVTRSSNAGKFTHPRACSVAATLQVMGDRWSFLLIRELFFGRHRFDTIQKQVGIATNILSARIRNLLENDVIIKSRDEASSAHFEYHLTASGRDLYPSFLAMLAWGDKWMANDKGVPLTLHHRDCNASFTPKVVCASCRQEIHARDMRYRAGPGWDVRIGREILEARMAEQAD